MSIEKQILSYFDEQELVHLLQQMIQHKSYSGMEGQLAHFLAGYLRNAGLDVEMQEVEPGRYNVIGTLKGTGGGESVLYNGHIDTNPVGRDWTVDPFAGVVENGCIYGIGVSNMKASDAAFVSAVCTIAKSKVMLKGDVIVTLVIGELQGGLGTVHMLNSGTRADWFINGEPTDLSLLTLHAGAFEAAIHVYGKSRHLSKAEEGVNAIEQAFKVIESLRHLKFSGATKPEYAGLNRYNIGVIRGGLGSDYLEWRVPQLPDLCTVKVALRYAPSQTPEGMIADVQTMLDKLTMDDTEFRAEIEIIRDLGMGPFEVDVNEPVVQAVQAAHRQITGTSPRIGDVAPYKYYGTDAAHFQQYGLKGVVYGCGGKYNTMPDERVELKDLLDCAKVYTLSIMELCNRAKSS